MNVQKRIDGSRMVTFLIRHSKTIDTIYLTVYAGMVGFLLRGMVA